MRKTSSLPNSGPENTDYPYGSIQDETSEIQGTPIIEATYSDFLQSLWHFFTLMNKVPNGLPENTTNGFQLLEVMERYFEPIASIKMFAGSDAAVPLNWLRCIGQTLASVDYPELFAIIGYTYGGSAGNFKLPDFSGRSPLGFGTGYTILGEKGGEKSEILTESQMPNHRHMNGIGDDHGTFNVYGKTTTNMPGQATRSVGDQDDARTYQGYTSLVGGGAAHNNMHPYLVLHIIIKVKYGAGIAY